MRRRHNDVRTTSKQRRFCNVDNSSSERRRNNVDYTTSIIRREGDVETTSIFSRSTSRLHFDEISTSKRRRVPAGKLGRRGTTPPRLT